MRRQQRNNHKLKNLVQSTIQRATEQIREIDKVYDKNLKIYGVTSDQININIFNNTITDMRPQLSKIFNNNQINLFLESAKQSVKYQLTKRSYSVGDITPRNINHLIEMNEIDEEELKIEEKRFEETQQDQEKDEIDEDDDLYRT